MGTTSKTKKTVKYGKKLIIGINSPANFHSPYGNRIIYAEIYYICLENDRETYWLLKSKKIINHDLNSSNFIILLPNKNDSLAQLYKGEKQSVNLSISSEDDYPYDWLSKVDEIEYPIVGDAALLESEKGKEIYYRFKGTE